MKPRWIACLAFLLTTAAAHSVLAREGETIIREMTVSATVTEEGVLSVEETLTVFAAGESSVDVTRGVSGRFGRRGKNGTGFVLLSATLDGQPTKTAIRRGPETLRLTLAARGTPLSPGTHVFKLRYDLINMVSFQPEEDSLEWQLVRESSCPILSLLVSVKLPDRSGSASPRRFSGRMSGRPEGDGVQIGKTSLSTLKPLPAGESFTLSLDWDKGLVAEKDPSFSPWRPWDLAVLGLLAAYYALTWFFYGRAPKRGVAAPGTEAPEGLPPGLLRCVRYGSACPRILAAEILNLAVKGRVRLESTVAQENGRKEEREGPRYSSLERMMDRRYRLHLNSNAASSLSPTEAVLLHNLFPPRDESVPLTLDDSGAPQVKAAFRALTRSFADLGQRFSFQHMRRWVLGLFFFEAYTAFVMLQTLSRAVGGIEPGSEHALAFVAPLFFLTPLLGGTKIWRQTTPLFILRTGLPLFFCACALGILHEQGADPVSISALAGGIAIIGFFWQLAPSRSPEGQRLLDEIEGFQLGLGSRAELKPQDDVEKFERLLPYAYALGLEQALISRYALLISRLPHRAKWHSAENHGLSNGAEHYTLVYELGEAIKTILKD
ncbi:MAG: DUF2207 domain-containing protein [Synergistaceae bacterium]|nr:DUF2207 domain-containing protein [Synergistaceae bacterium]